MALYPGKTLLGFPEYQDTLFGVNGKDNVLDGGDGNDILRGADGNDLLLGGNGDDLLQADWGRDTLYGGAGNDRLYIGSGSAIIDGGSGDDTILTGMGPSTILWGTGSGNDTIFCQLGCNTTKEQHTIQFTDLTAESVNFAYRDYDLIVENTLTGETLKFSAWFMDDNFKVGAFQFADGTSYTAEQVGELALNPYLNGNDLLWAENGRDVVLNGYGGNDYLYGGDGNDTLNGGIGDDYLQATGCEVLNGGAGNDILAAGYGGSVILDGGVGNDIILTQLAECTILWGTGSGNDLIDTYSEWGKNQAQTTVQFGSDITQANLQFAIKQNDLVFTNTQTQETLTINYWQLGNEFKVDNFIFGDGTRLTADDCQRRLGQMMSM